MRIMCVCACVDPLGPDPVAPIIYTEQTGLLRSLIRVDIGLLREPFTEAAGDKRVSAFPRRIMRAGECISQKDGTRNASKSWRERESEMETKVHPVRARVRYGDTALQISLLEKTRHELLRNWENKDETEFVFTRIVMWKDHWRNPLRYAKMLRPDI